MKENNVISLENPEQLHDPLADLLKSGARQLIRQYVDAELQELLVQYQSCLTETGKPSVVRNGYLPERDIQTGIWGVV